MRFVCQDLGGAENCVLNNNVVPKEPNDIPGRDTLIDGDEVFRGDSISTNEELVAQDLSKEFDKYFGEKDAAGKTCKSEDESDKRSGSSGRSNKRRKFVG